VQVNFLILNIACKSTFGKLAIAFKNGSKYEFLKKKYQKVIIPASPGLKFQLIIHFKSVNYIKTSRSSANYS
jgi:hypothetical protein